MIPDRLHDDWPWPFSLIPRKWTGINSDKPPKKLLGTVSKWDYLDIPSPGLWVLTWPLFFALTTKNTWHFRVGLRYDYIDHYYQPSFTVKRIKK